MGNLWIGRYFQINVFIHWTFWLLPLFIAMDRSTPEAILPLRLALFFGVFTCVLLHEFGHALTARAFGIQTLDIKLYPIGGVARLARMSERAWEEFWITVAGPAVNLVIALLLVVPVGLLLAADPELLTVKLGRTDQNFLGQFVFLLMLCNIVLFLFNLLPVFPMDGGRILRSLLSMLVGHVPATRVAVIVGAVMAALMGLVGFLVLSQGSITQGAMLIVVAFFVFLAGQQELLMLRARERRRRQLDDEEPLPVIPVRRPTTSAGAVPVIPLLPLRPIPPVEPAPLLSLQPRISVSTFDPVTGQWVEEPRPQRRSL